MTTNMPTKDIRAAVREVYGKIAERNRSDADANCGCSSTQVSCCGSDDDVIDDVVNLLYEDTGVNDLPSEVTDISLGCGDPITLAPLTEGQNVLDLGSGGGIDCFLASKKVGPAGKVIGVDMTPAMIDRARTNKQKIGAENVDFRLGEIENLPVSDDMVDVIISNCVINLSPDKSAVYREAFRVLKPGGRLAISDIVTDGDLPDVIKDSLDAWAGCISGAIDINDLMEELQSAGFQDVDVKPSYWSSEIIDAALDQLDPEIQAQVKENQENGKKSLLINKPDGTKIVDDFGDGFDPQKAIFSAKITAWKPNQ